jgi:hypothetical protein
MWPEDKQAEIAAHGQKGSPAAASATYNRPNSRFQSTYSSGVGTESGKFGGSSRAASRLAGTATAQSQRSQMSSASLNRPESNGSLVSTTTEITMTVTDDLAGDGGFDDSL